MANGSYSLAEAAGSEPCCVLLARRVAGAVNIALICCLTGSDRILPCRTCDTNLRYAGGGAAFRSLPSRLCRSARWSAMMVDRKELLVSAVPLTLRIDRGAREGELQMIAEGFDPITVRSASNMILRPEGHGAPVAVHGTGMSRFLLRAVLRLVEWVDIFPLNYGGGRSPTVSGLTCRS
jgi:hypothetical protein